MAGVEDIPSLREKKGDVLYLGAPESRTEPQRNRECPLFSADLAAAHHRDVVGRPAAVRHAGARRARRLGRTPEPDAVEVIESVGLAALGPEERIAFARGRYRGHRAEPGSQVALHLGIE